MVKMSPHERFLYELIALMMQTLDSDPSSTKGKFIADFLATTERLLPKRLAQVQGFLVDTQQIARTSREA